MNVDVEQPCYRAETRQGVSLHHGLLHRHQVKCRQTVHTASLVVLRDTTASTLCLLPIVLAEFDGRLLLPLGCVRLVWAAVL